MVAISIRFHPNHFIAIPSLDTDNAHVAVAENDQNVIVARTPDGAHNVVAIIFPPNAPLRILVAGIDTSGVRNGVIRIKTVGSEIFTKISVIAFCCVNSFSTTQLGISVALTSFALQSEIGNLRLSNPYIPKDMRS
ncbi:MAG: hypothetical protein LBI39_01580 [Puniceicoccales bacterium]|nr:hypothetical protein [Puniceicoccales bacterium]